MKVSKPLDHFTQSSLVLKQKVPAYAVVVDDKIWDAYFTTLKNARTVAAARKAQGLLNVQIWRFVMELD
jgi:hypothetical protein